MKTAVLVAFYVIFFQVVAGPPARAGDAAAGAASSNDFPPVPSGGKASKEGVMDFDADVIQGERRRPDLFIQLENDHSGLANVLYRRQDFNDFHQVDRLWRPSYYEITPSPAAKTAPARKRGGGGK